MPITPKHLSKAVYQKGFDNVEFGIHAARAPYCQMVNISRGIIGTALLTTNIARLASLGNSFAKE